MGDENRLKVDQAILQRYGPEPLLISGYIASDPETADGDEVYYWTKLGLEVVDEFWRAFYAQVTGPVEGQQNGNEI